MRTYLAVALILLSSAAAGADWKLDCPATLPTSQSVAAPAPAGWTAVGRTASAVRDAADGVAIADATPPVSVSLFDGPPAEMADLVPDNPNAKVRKWTFGKTRQRDIFVVCNYADTRLKLARPVPATVASCAVAMGRDGGVGVLCR